MAGIGARDTGNGINVYKIHHYSGSSSPQALYYEQTAFQIVFGLGLGAML